MLPTLAEGERLLTRRVRRLRTGDLVVCRSPLEPDRLLVKRIAEIEGRRIRVQGDNAAASTDSREFGPIDRREVLGVACTATHPPRPPGGCIALPISVTNVDPASSTVEQRLEELGEFIRERREVARLSLRRLSELAGISNPYLSQIERGMRAPSARILQQLATALRISAETLYVRAGILEDRGEDDLGPRILADPNLSEDQRQALFRVYRSFRDLPGRRGASWRAGGAAAPRNGRGQRSGVRPAPTRGVGGA